MRKPDTLFYFFNLFFQPLEFALGIYLLGNVGDLMADHVFDGILVHTIAFGRGDEMGTAVVRAVVRIQAEFIPDALKRLLIPGVGQSDIFLLSAIGVDPVEQVGTVQLGGLFIFCLDQGAYLGMDWDNSVCASVRFHAALESAVFQVYILQLQQAQLLRPPAGVCQRRFSSQGFPKASPSRRL